jgi:hypothetical protein
MPSWPRNGNLINQLGGSNDRGDLRFVVCTRYLPAQLNQYFIVDYFVCSRLGEINPRHDVLCEVIQTKDC